MAKKESNEFNTFLGRGTNAVLADHSDGDLNPVQDFQEYISTLLAAQPAFQGLGLYKEEKATETVSEKKEQLAILNSEIKAGTPETNYDFAAAFHGLQCLYSMAVRGGYEAGEKAGYNKALKTMEKQGHNVSALKK